MSPARGVRSAAARGKDAVRARLPARRGPSSETPGTFAAPARGAAFRSHAAAALDALQGTPRPALIAYMPLVRNNPYQAMLYSSCWEKGIAVIEVDDVIDPASSPTERADVWFHMHWTSPVLRRAASRADARRRLDRFRSRLDRLAEGGGRIMWTVHNVLPHERRFSDLEAEVGRTLAERADVIHVLHERTPELTEPHFSLPAAKVTVIPHASYVGLYPDLIGRIQARHLLGVPRDALTFAFVGGMRPYKGIDRLIAAFRSVAARRDDVHLLLAGPGLAAGDIKAVRSRARSVPGLTLRSERIPEWDLQLYFNAADVAVLPYEDVLNSGALMLAFTFGRPVIASSRGVFTDLVTKDVGELFDPDDPGALERALESADALRDPSFSGEARARAAAYPPRAMADDFANLVLSRTRGRATTT